MYKASDYNLPDQQILIGKPDNKLFVWQPDNIYLVLGRSNQGEEAIDKNQESIESIKILKRPSGGETVLLSSNMLVIATLIAIQKGMKPKDYFVKANDIIIKTLSEFGVKNLSTKGISDISIGEKKILGSAIYKTSNAYFYHAILNIKEDISLISKYIKHPKREPDYRKGRSHTEFVTSLWKEGYQIEIKDLEVALKNLEV